jgi:hypothetical protein
MSTARRVSLGMTGSTSFSSSSNKGRKSSSLPAETVEYLKAWMMSPEHIAHPYPTEQEKAEIMADTGIELKQLTNWFVNNRKRYWKPRVEAKLKQQARVATTAATQANVKAHQGAGVVGALLSSETATPVSPDAKSLSSKRSMRRNASVVSFDMAPEGKQAASGKFQAISSSEYAPAVSEASSSASVTSSDEGSFNVQEDESGYSSDLTTEDLNFGLDQVKRLELVDVHVFRPASGDASDLTIDDISTEYNGKQVLQTFYQCEISYSFPESDSVKVRSLTLVLQLFSLQVDG